MTTFTLHPIGCIGRSGDAAWIDVFEAYADGLHGLDGFSHIEVLFWFHENDTAAGRRTLMVHPRRDPSKPLTGVFATRSPLRPNLIGLTRCRVLSIEGLRIRVDGLDARDGTPVLDIKCHIPDAPPVSEVRVPAWV